MPVSKTDVVRLKNEEPKYLKVIGFTDSFRVPRHFFCQMLILLSLNQQALKILTINSEIVKMNKMIIVRYVYRNNSQLKLVVLTPHMSKKETMFYLNILPKL